MDTATNGHAEPTYSHQQLLHLFSTLQQRVDFASLANIPTTFKGSRNFYVTLGYSEKLCFQDYKLRYERGDISARIINAFPAATWHNRPVVHERDKPDETEDSQFEKDWQSLVDRLRIYQALERVDRLASLGHYAVIVIGIRGQQDWGSEATRIPGEEAIAFLSTYSEEHTGIKGIVDAADSPLFGQPKSYDIDFSRAEGNEERRELLPEYRTGMAAVTSVHGSRVIHIAEDGLEDNIIGTPRLRCVWNALDDLDKVRGGSAEMFWVDAKRRLFVGMKEDTELDPTEEAKLEDRIDDFIHQLKNVIWGQGIDVKPIEGNTPDPSNHIDKLLDIIAGGVGIPKRMLIGSERGELASSQDENNWAQRIMERQKHHAEPNMLRPLIDRFIQIGALKPPAGGYEVEWPNLCARTEKEDSDIALNWARAIKEYAGATGDPQEIVPVEIFLEDIFGFSKEQIARITELMDQAVIEDAEIASAA